MSHCARGLCGVAVEAIDAHGSVGMAADAEIRVGLGHAGRDGAGVAVDAALVRRGQLSEEWRLLLVTGFLGGLTTFSAYSFETLVLAHEEAFGMALANTLANVVLSLLAAWIGWRLCHGG